MDSDRDRLIRMLAHIHGALLVVLIALRPLVWDGDAASPANLVYLALIQLALLLTAAEIAGGLRTMWRWSWTGLVFALLTVALIPAAWHAPVPAVGSAFIWQLGLHLGLGAYLLQMIPGRERLVWSALVAGLGCEVAIGWVQGLYVLPKMIDTSSLNGTAVAAEGVAVSDLTERVLRGGWFGTFTLSNTLAAWLLLVVIPLAAVALRAASGRWFAALLTVAGCGLFLATRSKGALIAVAIAVGIWWLIYQRGWRRWLPVPLAIAATALLLMLPAFHDGLAASARVRWGYWSGAVTLVREAPVTGHGIGAFAERSSGVMPLWSEPSRLVHNEPLEMAVIAGIPLALLFVALLVMVSRPRRAGADENTVTSESSPEATWLAPLCLVMVTAYLCLLGMLDGNLGWWPGGGSPIGQGLWGLVIGCGLAGLLFAARQLALPSVVWLRLALAATALHALIDFDLHSFAVVGTLIVVAVLAGGRRHALPINRLTGVAMLLGVVLLGAGWLTWVSGALELRATEDLVRTLRLVRDPAHAEEGLSSLAAQLGVPEPPVGDRRGQTELVRQAVAIGLGMAIRDPGVELQLLGVLPPSPERLARLDALLPRMAYSSSLAGMRAQDLFAAGRYEEAVTEMRRGISLSPAYLPARRELEALLARAAERDTAHAQRWRSEREQVAAEREALSTVVDYRNRIR